MPKMGLLEGMGCLMLAINEEVERLESVDESDNVGSSSCCCCC